MNKRALAHGRGSDNRQATHTASTTFKSHAATSKLQVQSQPHQLPHYPFQPLPTPIGPAPYRFDLAQLLHADEVAQIEQHGKLVLHTVGDTGDERGKQMDFVAAMMKEDYNGSPKGEAPACYYHLGDVVYFAGDVDKYGNCFYETYAEYPGPIVAIAGNHDCQPDDPQDGPIDPNKKPLDGWVQNFMSPTPTKLGSLKTTSSRTQMDLPNVYWTFTTPLATIIGLFSNVSETQAEVHQDQIDWFRSELKAADPGKALIVAIHHPPYSGDDEHSGSTEAEKILFESFAATKRFPHLVLSGHVHNYQRFTVDDDHGQVSCVVAGAGGYSKLGTLRKIGKSYPKAPLQLSDTLTLENYIQDQFGFLRLEISKEQIVGKYLSAVYQESKIVEPDITDQFTIDVATRKLV